MATDSKLPVCKKLFLHPSGQAFGCGQCLPCRIRNRRVKTSRCDIERLLYSDSIYLTLTYDDFHLPRTDSGLPTLRRSDLRAFIVRLRKRLYPRKVRIFYVGEYGDQNSRPHYHLLLFGLHYELDAKAIKLSWSCHTKHAIGSCKILPLNDGAADYVCGYVTKKMTDPNHRDLRGREPEFAQGPTRDGGLGGPALDILCAPLHRDRGLDSVLKNGDVPAFLIMGGKTLYLGRHLRKKMRQRLGDENLNQFKLAELKKIQQVEFKSSGFSHKQEQRVLNRESKFRNRRKK